MEVLFPLQALLIHLSHSMKKLLLGLALVAVAFLGFSPTVRAQTAAELQAQIQSLMTLIQGLQAQVANQQPSTVSCLEQFQRDLVLGMEGQDVANLQTYLAERGFLAVSEGTTKGYYGTLTAGAVANYQTTVGISPADGKFTLVTRVQVNAEIQAICDKGGGDAISVNSVTGPVSLQVNERGTWRVNVTAPASAQLEYAVSWGDTKGRPTATNAAGFSFVDEASFTHSFSRTAVYTITFWVRDVNQPKVDPVEITKTVTVITSAVSPSAIRMISPNEGDTVTAERNSILEWRWDTMSKEGDEISNVDLYLLGKAYTGIFAKNYPNHGTFWWRVGTEVEDIDLGDRIVLNGSYIVLVCPAGISSSSDRCGKFDVVITGVQPEILSFTAQKTGDAKQTVHLTWKTNIPTYASLEFGCPGPMQIYSPEDRKTFDCAKGTETQLVFYSNQSGNTLSIQPQGNSGRVTVAFSLFLTDRNRSGIGVYKSVDVVFDPTTASPTTASKFTSPQKADTHAAGSSMTFSWVRGAELMNVSSAGLSVKNLTTGQNTTIATGINLANQSSYTWAIPAAQAVGSYRATLAGLNLGGGFVSSIQTEDFGITSGRQPPIRNVKPVISVDVVKSLTDSTVLTSIPQGSEATVRVKATNPSSVNTLSLSFPENGCQGVYRAEGSGFNYDYYNANPTCKNTAGGAIVVLKPNETKMWRYTTLGAKISKTPGVYTVTGEVRGYGEASTKVTVTSSSGSASSTAPTLTLAAGDSDTSAVVSTDDDSTDNDQGKFVVNFDATAGAAPAYIPLSAARGSGMTLSAGAQYVVEDTSNAVISTGATTATLEPVSGGSIEGNYVKINIGETAKLRLTVYHNPTVSGVYRAQLKAVNFAGAAVTPTIQKLATPETDFQTPSEQVLSAAPSARQTASVLDGAARVWQAWSNLFK